MMRDVRQARRPTHTLRQLHRDGSLPAGAQAIGQCRCGHQRGGHEALQVIGRELSSGWWLQCPQCGCRGVLEAAPPRCEYGLRMGPEGQRVEQLRQCTNEAYGVMTSAGVGALPHVALCLGHALALEEQDPGAQLRWSRLF